MRAHSLLVHLLRTPPHSHAVSCCYQAAGSLARLREQHSFITRHLAVIKDSVASLLLRLTGVPLPVAAPRPSLAMWVPLRGGLQSLTSTQEVFHAASGCPDHCVVGPLESDALACLPELCSPTLMHDGSWNTCIPRAVGPSVQTCTPLFLASSC